MQLDRSFSQTKSNLKALFLEQLTLPVHILVEASIGRGYSKSVLYHEHSWDLPDGSLVDLGEEISVVSAELCFFIMASRLPLVKLIELGFELCGNYSLKAAANDEGGVSDGRCEFELGSESRLASKRSAGFYSRPPLTSVKKLAVFSEQMSGNRGCQQALRALRYIVDGSASPMETILVILLMLPFNHGGYGFSPPEMNFKIRPVRAIRQSSHSQYYLFDLYWPQCKLAVEYDSDQYHTGAERIASDSKRRNTLTSLGIKTITVTNQQIRNIKEFEKVANLIAVNMGRRLRYRKPDFLIAQCELRASLFG